MWLIITTFPVILLCLDYITPFQIDFIGPYQQIEWWAVQANPYNPDIRTQRRRGFGSSRSAKGSDQGGP